MTQVVKRGYNPKDKVEFGSSYTTTLNKAGEELYYLINRGYDIKSTSTFIGNHYMLSERQRLALTRIVSPEISIQNRIIKELTKESITKKVYIDGFNTIITLEVMLSDSLILKGMDGTYRDLAGLRGTYRIVDKTLKAVQLTLQSLEELGVEEALFYLDKPVSNSGRLKELIYEYAKNYKISVEIEVIYDVDRSLSRLKGIITSDAIILDHCISWFNLIHWIIGNVDMKPWIFSMDSNILPVNSQNCKHC